MATPNQDLKVCRTCAEPKPVDDFYFNGGSVYKGRSYGPYRTSQCKACTILRSDVNYKRRKAEDPAREAFIQRAQRVRVRDIVFGAYGGYTCICCGETEELFLTLDHTCNQGGKWRKETLGTRTAAGYHTYRWLLRNGCPEGVVQVMCMNCQHGKLMNKGVCPHQSGKA